jgi:predicted DNA helicase
VDLLVEKLHERGIKVLRVGNPARINSHIQEHSLSWKITQHPDFSLIKKMKKQSAEFRNMASKYKRNFGYSEREQRKALFDEAWKLQKDAQQIEDYITNDLIENAQVIATTLVGSSAHMIRNRKYGLCVIDEASQALEPASWIPIIRSDKVIMAGDHQQLPPTVKSFEADKGGLSKSLFETCIEKLDVSVMLSTQYRMNEHIMHFSSNEFYNQGLEAHESVASHSLDIDSPVVEFVDTAGCSFDEESANKSAKTSGSLFNFHEADLLWKHIYGLYEHLKNNNYPFDDLTCGIISPYKGQVEHLKKQLNDFPFQTKNISINTVDGFQGQERDIIYISLVRSNDNNEIGFLKDYRRMNVALTRARKKLVVIGDSSTIANDKFYNSFIDYVESTGGYSTAWEYLYQ